MYKIERHGYIKAIYEPTSWHQLRLFLAALSCWARGDNQVVSFPAGALAELSNSEICQAAAELRELVISVQCYINGDDLPYEVIGRVVDFCKYRESDGCVKLHFTPHIAPHLPGFLSSLKTVWVLRDWDKKSGKKPPLPPEIRICQFG